MIRQSKRNKERARRIEPAMGAYATGEKFEDDKETNLTDILTDLMHWSDKHGLNFGRSSRLAKMHHDVEVKEQ